MSQALTTRPTYGVRNLTLVVLAVWFLFALGGSLLGLFDSGPRPPLLLGLAAAVPVARTAPSGAAAARPMKPLRLKLSLTVSPPVRWVGSSGPVTR